MPHKRNPVAALRALQAATLAPGLAAGLIGGLVGNQHERGLGGWQSERLSLEPLSLLAHGAAAALARASASLVIDTGRMALNAALQFGVDASERAMVTLSRRLPRGEALALVDRAVKAALAERRPFAEMLAMEPGVTREDVDALAEPGAALGQSARFAGALIASVRDSLGTVRHGRVGAQGASLGYRLEGEAGRPVLVLGNSLGTDMSLWDEVMPRLGRHARILRFDLPGHGLSDVVPEITIPEIAALVVAMLDREGIATAHYAGVSVGGQIGQALLLRHGDRLRSAVLCCTGARLGSEASWGERVALVERGGMAELAAMVIPRWFSPATDEALRAVWRRKLAMVDGAGYVALCRALARADFRAALAGIAPALGRRVLCVAGADDLAAPREGMAALAEGIAGARLVVLERVGHLPPVEAPAELSALVLRQIAGPPQASGSPT